MSNKILDDNVKINNNNLNDIFRVCKRTAEYTGIIEYYIEEKREYLTLFKKKKYKWVQIKNALGDNEIYTTIKQTQIVLNELKSKYQKYNNEIIDINTELLDYQDKFEQDNSIYEMSINKYGYNFYKIYVRFYLKKYGCYSDWMVYVDENNILGFTFNSLKSSQKFVQKIIETRPIMFEFYKPYNDDEIIEIIPSKNKIRKL